MVAENNSTPISTVLLAGASGYIGRHVAKALLDAGLNVVCLYRAGSSIDMDADLGSKSGQVTNLVVDFNNANAFTNNSNFLPVFDAVVSCIASRTGGIEDSWRTEYLANLNIYHLAKRRSVKRFVLLSAICVQKPRLHFQKAKLAMENELTSGSIPYTIIRPTAFFKSLAGQLENVKSGKRFIIFDGGEQASCKPISERDLAHFICISLLDRATENKILPIGGPGPALTQKDQGRLLFQLTSKNQRFLVLPSKLFKFFQALLSPISHFSVRTRDLIEYLRIAYYYATESMLCWDENLLTFSSENTPEFGKEDLKGFYSKVLMDGMEEQRLGNHKLF